MNHIAQTSATKTELQENVKLLMLYKVFNHT